MVEITQPTLTDEQIKIEMEKQRKKDIKTFKKIEKIEKIKRKTKTIKKQKIIGTETYINRETGEIIEANVIEKSVEADYGFFKVWLLDLMNILELVGTKKMRVVNYIFENLKGTENLFIATHEEIAKKLNISRPVVSQTFKILLEANLLVKKQNGVYMINPDIIARVNNPKRMSLLIKYNEIKMEKS